MRLSSKQSCRSCGALPNNLISLLPTCLIVMDFDDDDDDDTEFNAAAGAILAITSATATAIATPILPWLQVG